MAEQEVVKHTKKVYKIWSSKEHSFWHKMKEFLIEIFIIVFAVSLSIWLHDRSEYNHQQKEVKEFLLGLREDLQSDIKEMKSDRKSYVLQGHIFSYVTSVKQGQPLDMDTLKKYQTWLYSTTRLQLNDGRFEGFKASGKIGNIEDKKIQDKIMDLYQEDIPALLAATDPYLRWKYQFFDYGVKNRKKNANQAEGISTMLMTDEAQNLCGFLANPGEIISRYDNCINKMEEILTQIEDLYHIKEK